MVETPHTPHAATPHAAGVLCSGLPPDDGRSCRKARRLFAQALILCVSAFAGHGRVLCAAPASLEAAAETLANRLVEDYRTVEPSTRTRTLALAGFEREAPESDALTALRLREALASRLIWREGFRLVLGSAAASTDLTLFGILEPAAGGLSIALRLTETAGGKVLLSERYELVGRTGAQAPSAPAAVPPTPSAAGKLAPTPRPAGRRAFWLSGAWTLHRGDIHGGHFGVAWRDARNAWEIGLDAGFFNHRSRMVLGSNYNAIAGRQERRQYDVIYERIKVSRLAPFSRLGVPGFFDFPARGHARLGAGLALYQTYVKYLRDNDPRPIAATTISQDFQRAVGSGFKVAPLLEAGLGFDLPRGFELHVTGEYAYQSNPEWGLFHYGGLATRVGLAYRWGAWRGEA